MRLTAKDRILIHLLDFAKYAEDPEVPPAMTQEGIAQASWIDDRHVPQNVRPLIREGLVRERTAHVEGSTPRRKVYDLTDLGRPAAVRLREALRAEVVKVRDPTGVREAALSHVLQEIGGKRSLLEIARLSVETGAVDLSTLASGPSTAKEIVQPEALQLEQDCHWLEAAEVYQSALASEPTDDSKKVGPLHERLGYALHRAALQASHPGEFRGRMLEALDNCEKARDAYGKSEDLASRARVTRCRATTAYLRFWLAGTIGQRRKELDEAWKFLGAALKELEEMGDAWEHGTTENQLSRVPLLRFFVAPTAPSQEPALREAIECGERTIRALSAFGDTRELANAYATTSRELDLLGYFIGGPEREALSRRAMDYWQKARDLSEETAMSEPFLARSFLGFGTDEILSMFGKAVEYARNTKDRFVVGWMLRQLAYHKSYRSKATADLDAWREVLDGALENAEDAKREFASIAFDEIIGGEFAVDSARAEYYDERSRRETDLQQRYELLKKGTEAAREGAKHAVDLGYPDPAEEAHWGCARVLIDLAKMETNSEVKKRLLEEALDHVEGSNRLQEERYPSLLYLLGEGKFQRAVAKSELAEVAETPEAKTRMLREATQDAETGQELCIRDQRFYEKRGDVAGFAEIGISQSECADMHARLFVLTRNPSDLRKAAEMLDRAAESFRRTNVPSRIAECHWKAGKIYDTLEDHAKASEEFAVACSTYKLAAARILQLKDFYQDLALYMQAWSEIEKARHHHGREEYGQAKDYYERAATLHGFSKHWSFMAPNYAAWAQVESAEDLSRAQKGPDAIVAFGEAGGLFHEARVSLEAVLDSIQDLDERRMIEALIVAAERRRQYCSARVALEQANALDMEGDHSSSSQRYGQAADGFEKLAAAAESDRDRRDLSLIATLAKAWEAMTKAEADAAPELYAEAARFFEAARELGASERAKALALGHSRFCNALEAGAKFVDRRDQELYASAIRHLDSAASHYARAGAESASEYSRASKLLFDAYAAMDRAGNEADLEKKAKTYVAVEKILEASAAAFGKAEYPGKRDQALHLLENVKRERELAASLLEVFRAPRIVSSTTAFATPTPSYEQAVGIEKLEHADIRASLIPGARALVVGEDLDLMLELVNAGRAAGQLIKVEGLVPREFELVAKPETYEVEENSLNFRGKRLEPLKTEQVRVVLRAVAEGVLNLRLRIMYLDESGNYRSHEPEPVEVKVIR